MAISEEQLGRWAQGPSQTEAERCEATIRRISDALRSELGSRVTVFLQGSYRNRTNVRQESDVDVVVLDDLTYFPDLSRMSAAALAAYNANRAPADQTFDQFKAQVYRLLVTAFGQRVERRNKCILVPETASGVDGDVVPAFGYKRFNQNGGVDAEGIRFLTDDGRQYNSFPEQHYANGISKNDATGRMYKRLVRILKNVRLELVEQGSLPETVMSSFVIECLVFNAPNATFGGEGYFLRTKQVIEALWTLTDCDSAGRVTEVNKLKPLFGEHRTAIDARTFLQAAYSFIGH